MDTQTLNDSRIQQYLADIKEWLSANGESPAADGQRPDAIESLGAGLLELRRRLQTLQGENEAFRMELAEHEKELHDLEEFKNYLLGMAAHDLRSPLAVILTSCNIMLDEMEPIDPDTRREFMETIRNTAHNMLGMLNVVLDYSAIKSGKLSLDYAPVSLKPLIEKAVEMQNRLAERKGSIIHMLNIPEAKFIADERRLLQVLDNLLSNALKYSPPQSEVMISALTDENNLRVEVMDQGPGISEADRPKLFRSFSRLSNRPTGGESSIGLGLTIARRIVEEHGGRIDFSSIVGAGSTFWFVIPLRPAIPEGLDFKF
jgi:two-component system, sensor histidine kinase and response regulator